MAILVNLASLTHYGQGSQRVVKAAFNITGLGAGTIVHEVRVTGTATDIEKLERQAWHQLSADIATFHGHITNTIAAMPKANRT